MGTKHRMLQRGRPHRSECQTSRCWLQVCLQAGRESWCSSPTCSLTNPDRDNIRSWILNAKKKRTKNNGRIGCPNETINVCDCIFLVFSLMPCFFFFKACFIRVRVGLFFCLLCSFLWLLHAVTFCVQNCTGLGSRSYFLGGLIWPAKSLTLLFRKFYLIFYGAYRLVCFISSSTFPP